jgi:aldose 1-epimerase
MSVVPPSGHQIQLRAGRQEAVVVEVGGGLRSYAADGMAVLDSYAEAEMSFGAQGHPLLPWPNRLDGGWYVFDGRRLQLPLNEVAAGNAIHGLTNWAVWQAEQVSAATVTMTHTLHPQPGWMWTLDLAITYALNDDGLRVTTTAVNRSDSAAPFGAGFHPYFRPPSGRCDLVVMELPAAVYDEADERNIPRRRVPVDDTPYDFRQPRLIGDLPINLGYTGLARAADGTATCTVTQPGTTWSVAIDLGPGWNWIVVYTGDELPKARREAVAIEPMSGPANLLQTGEGRIRLEPGGRWEATWAMRPRWLHG